MAENRRDLPVPVKVTLTRPGDIRTTEYAVNLSAGGVCLQVREPLAPDQRVHLEFRLPTDEEPFRLDGAVVWCSDEEVSADATRFRELGIRFDAGQSSQLGRLARFTTRAGDSRR